MGSDKPMMLKSASHLPLIDKSKNRKHMRATIAGGADTVSKTSSQDQGKRFFKGAKDSDLAGHRKNTPLKPSKSPDKLEASKQNAMKKL